jgi:hypothetical protein
LQPQLLSQPQLGAGAAQVGAAQPQLGWQQLLQQRLWWWQRCLQHELQQLLQLCWQPQLLSQPQVSQPQPPPYPPPPMLPNMAARRSNAKAWDDIQTRPTAITAANTRLFMGRLLK